MLQGCRHTQTRPDDWMFTLFVVSITLAWHFLSASSLVWAKSAFTLRSELQAEQLVPPRAGCFTVGRFLMANSSSFSLSNKTMAMATAAYCEAAGPDCRHQPASNNHLILNPVCKRRTGPQRKPHFAVCSIKCHSFSVIGLKGFKRRFKSNNQLCCADCGVML